MLYVLHSFAPTCPADVSRARRQAHAAGAIHDEYERQTDRVPTMAYSPLTGNSPCGHTFDRPIAHTGTYPDGSPILWVGSQTAHSSDRFECARSRRPRRIPVRDDARSAQRSFTTQRPALRSTCFLNGANTFVLDCRRRRMRHGTIDATADQRRRAREIDTGAGLRLSCAARISRMTDSCSRQISVTATSAATD